LNFGVAAGLGVDDGASPPCAVVAAPAGDAPDAADGAVPVLSADASPAVVVGVAAADRFVAVPCFADGAVDVPCGEAASFDVSDDVPREEGLVVVDVLVLVAERSVFVAGLVAFGAEPFVFGADFVVLVAVLVGLVAGLVLAGPEAAGLVAPGLVVAVLVVVVLVAEGVGLAELVGGGLDGDPACC
jgi:hypothetical protein